MKNCESFDDRTEKDNEPSLPTAIRWAAGLLTAYAVLMASTIVFHALRLERANFFSNIVGLIFVAVVAWGLAHRMPWAWWSAIGLAFLFLVSGGVVAATLMTLGPADWISLMIPHGSYLSLCITIALLAAVVVLLLLPRSRAEFHVEAAKWWE